MKILIQNTLYSFPRSEDIKDIQIFLLQGFSPSDLMDERIFYPAFKSEDIFLAISQLNQFSKIEVLN